MKLIFIHGRDQQGLDPAKLRTTWLDTWKKGLAKSDLTMPADLEIIFPFYGDVLEDLSLKGTLSSTLEGVIARGDVLPQGFRVFSQILTEIAQNAEISDDEIRKNLNDDYVERGPLNWSWIQAILKVFDKTPIGTLSLKQFTYDVFLYLTVPAIRKKIDEFVKTTIDDSPCVVVGHSLGSVVGYNVLQSHASRYVRKYITVGSPLGLKSIRTRLDSPIGMPACINDGWFNAYDERDVVALQPLDKDNFNISPSIYNKNDVDNGTKNRHGIVGYLNDREVARVIYDSLLKV